MLVIGLTGGIGSGKSTVAELFAKKGVTIIDADVITRELTRPGQAALKKIEEHFGKDILNNDGTLNRNKLRKIIFENLAEKQWLEKLLHPMVRDEMKRQAELAPSSYCIAVIPLLLETEKNPLIDRILVVDTPEAIQLQRALSRDKSSEAEIQAILDAQLSREMRMDAADDVIDNWGSFEDLLPQVERLHRVYESLVGKKN